MLCSIGEIFAQMFLAGSNSRVKKVLIITIYAHVQQLYTLHLKKHDYDIKIIIMAYVMTNMKGQGSLYNVQQLYTLHLKKHDYDIKIIIMA